MHLVYCKDDRRGESEATSFTVLGHEFRARLAKNKTGKHFVSFLPAASKDAMKVMGQGILSWHPQPRDKALDDLSRMVNNIVQR